MRLNLAECECVHERAMFFCPVAFSHKLLKLVESNAGLLECLAYGDVQVVDVRERLHDEVLLRARRDAFEKLAELATAKPRPGLSQHGVLIGQQVDADELHVGVLIIAVVLAARDVFGGVSAGKHHLISARDAPEKRTLRWSELHGHFEMLRKSVLE